MMSAMKFRHELRYDAPPADVFAMLADPDFRRAVGTAQDVVSAEVTITPQGDGFVLRNDQVQKTAGLPSIAQKFVSDTTRAVQHEDWSGPRAASVVIEAPGKPAEIKGTARLEDAAGGTLEVVELEVKVKVPLIGGKLEALLADRLHEALDAENAVGRRWLAGER